MESTAKIFCSKPQSNVMREQRGAGQGWGALWLLCPRGFNPGDGPTLPSQRVSSAVAYLEHHAHFSLREQVHAALLVGVAMLFPRILWCRELSAEKSPGTMVSPRPTSL